LFGAELLQEREADHAPTFTVQAKIVWHSVPTLWRFIKLSAFIVQLILPEFVTPVFAEKFKLWKLLIVQFSPFPSYFCPLGCEYPTFPKNFPFMQDTKFDISLLSVNIV
jgi:hypothetical protein